MKILLVLALLFAPSLAAADDTKTSATVGARLVPALQDGELVGLKIYAIRKNGRSDRAQLQNGDTILTVDGVSVTTDQGTTALFDKLTSDSSDFTLEVRRRGKLVKLANKRS
jgi:S1-C subfamily serine protease